MPATRNIRTWRRKSLDKSLPLNDRVQETTDPSDIESSIREADFITIPRMSYTTSGQQVDEGYSLTYAQQLAQVLRDHFGYSGYLRQSRSGRSHVFERESADQGASHDFGLEELSTVARLPNTALKAA